MINLYY